MLRSLYFFVVLSMLFAQEQIDWEEKPNPITAIQIYCDTEGIPIFVDGLQVGASRVEDPVQVAPGWHQVSYFPPEMTVNIRAISENRKMRDMIKLARQDVLVDEGKTVRVVLSYRTIEAEAIEYERDRKSVV